MSSNRCSCAAVLACAVTVSLGSALLLPRAAQAGADYRGTEFWVGFLRNVRQDHREVPEHVSRHLFITADTDTTGTLSSPDLRGVPNEPYSQDFVVRAGETTQIDLSSFQFPWPSLRVTTDNEVAVYALSWATGTRDAFLVFPTETLGTENLAMTVHHAGGLQPWTGNRVLMISTVDGTDATILRRRDTYPDDPPFTITRDRGQPFVLGNFTDLSGSEIISSQPVAVFSGNTCGSIPGEGDPGDGRPPPDDPIEADPNSCSHLVEQMPPAQSWGRLFYLPSLAERPDGYVARVLAARDDTRVRINGTTLTLNRGQAYKQIIQEPAEIVADAPVLVAQLITGRQRDEDYERTFDHYASMMLVPPYEQFLDEYLITTPPGSFFRSQYVNLVVPAAAAGAVMIDGAVVAAEHFAPIGSSGFSGAQVPLAPGTHTLAGPSPFGVTVYGYGEHGSYSYPGGMSLSPVARVADVALEPESATHAVGSSGCIGASVVDANVQPLQDIRVDFAVTGANPSLGYDRTDAEGIASYCYAGTAAGEDRIVASVSTFDDSASKTWVAPDEQGVADIRFRPGSISCRTRGLRQLTVYGSAEFDVRQIVPASLRLAREDGTGAAAGPPKHYRLRDFGRGPDSGYRRDGFVDINMHFNAAGIAQLIDCSQLSGAESPALLVTGKLKDGTGFETHSATLTLRGRR